MQIKLIFLTGCAQSLALLERLTRQLGNGLLIKLFTPFLQCFVTGAIIAQQTTRIYFQTS